ncbi:MAG TPA: hypothetical protein DIU37_00780 [Opitutae bacterium]|nr:hypothetical protein [Opitutae bacterium]
MKNKPTKKLLLTALICTLSINGLFGYGLGYPFGKPEATDEETEALNEYITHNAAINPFYLNYFFADVMAYYLANNGVLLLAEHQREIINMSRASYQTLFIKVKKFKHSEHAHQLYTNLFWNFTYKGNHYLAFLLLTLVGPESIIYDKETILNELTKFGALEETFAIFIKANSDHALLEKLIEENLRYGKGLKPLGFFKTNDIETFNQIQDAEYNRTTIEALILEHTHPLEEKNYKEFIDILKNGPIINYTWSKNKKYMEYAIITGNNCAESGWHDSANFSCTLAVLGNSDKTSNFLDFEAIMKDVIPRN